MAVIVSNGSTNLSTTNGFYRAEAYNMFPHYYAAPASALALSTLRTWDVTFANAGNLLGVVLQMSLFAGTSASLDVALLEKIGTFTISIGVAAVVTLVNHGLLDGQEVILETTGFFHRE
jgi:predicted membrane protein